MSDIAAKLDEAHKLACAATGRISIALARKRMPKDLIETTERDLSRALKIIQSLMGEKKPWKK